MRILPTLFLAAASLAAAPELERVAFKLPAPDGKIHELKDFGSRYLLLVYQGIP